MSDEEIDRLEDILAHHPGIGDEMIGTGGCRKMRFAKPGKGKSGGYRVITFFTGESLPVFLITVFGKNERSNLSKAERNSLKKLSKELVDTYKSRVIKVRRA